MIDFVKRNHLEGCKPLADNIPKLTGRDVLEHATERLQRNLRFKAAGYVCNREQLIQILLGIAATKNTLEAVCAELDTRPLRGNRQKLFAGAAYRSRVAQTGTRNERGFGASPATASVFARARVGD